jgi:hypothetical protein
MTAITQEQKRRGRQLRRHNLANNDGIIVFIVVQSDRPSINRRSSTRSANRNGLPTRRHRDERVRLGRIRPAHRQRELPAVPVEEEHPILRPRAEPQGTQTPARTTDETGASPEQFADHRPDQAQLTTLDNALAETTVGSFKNELIRRQGPWRDGNQVEIATAKWVLWFNTERPHEYLDDFTPEAVEKLHYDHRRSAPKAG